MNLQAFMKRKKKMLLGGFDGEDKERVRLFLNVCSFSYIQFLWSLHAHICKTFKMPQVNIF